MGCCASREDDEKFVKVAIESALNSEFDSPRTLLGTKYSEEHAGDFDLSHGFSHSFQLNNTSDIHDVYKMNRETLGQGAAGYVCKGVHKSTKAERAIKILSPAQLGAHALVALKAEVGIMRMLDHPHIIKLCEVFHDAKFVYLVMELCTGGELFDRIVQEFQPGSLGFSEHRAAEFMKQIMSALCYLHKHNIVHRDLKPENVLLQDTSPDAKLKLIDFGIACQIKKGSVLTARVGTTSYVAPEVLAQCYDHKADIWSCGVMCYILLSGSQPFDGEDQAVMKMIKKAKYDFPAKPWDNISDDAKDLIESMLTLRADDRPEASHLLQHVWMQNNIEKPMVSMDPSIINNFRSFNQSRKMKQLSLTLIATQLQEQDVARLRLQFEALDTNGDGVLSKEEIEQGLQALTGSDDGFRLRATSYVDQIMAIDSDGSGEIDWTEFVAASIDSQKYNKRDVLWNAFRTFDLDGDGSISKSELRQVMEAGNSGVSDEQIQELMNDGDEDGDGEIDFEEFMKMMDPPSSPEAPVFTGEKSP